MNSKIVAGWLGRRLLALMTVGFIGLMASCLAAAADKPAVDYNRDVRPILADKCYKCHGPDAKERQAGLRLDEREPALRALDSGATAIVPGKPDDSELVKRIFSDDDSIRMPPAKEKKHLTLRDKQLLRSWIEGGAGYHSHWAFLPPKRPTVPSVQNKEWPRNEIDSFILARLEAEGMKPSPESNKEQLLRRVTFDLTGLPPTLAEIDSFLADSSPGAYERVVDRLLGSMPHGERMALDWLDAARYADTHGYHIDSGRDMSRWREWVIDSFHRNLPFDQFTIDQLAGDLLPNSTVEQQIASGFNRNHMINFEGGAIPEEYHTAYIVDRVNTTSTVWLGLTLGCTQCHDHKFDPFTQQEFYQLFAFFHNVPESGLDGAKGNASPFIKAPSPDQRDELSKFDAVIRELETQLTIPMPELDTAQAAWERDTVKERHTVWHLVTSPELKSEGGAKLTKLDDQSIRAGGKNPATDNYVVKTVIDLPRVTAIRLEALPDDGLTAKGPGRSVNGNVVLTNVRVSVQAKDGTGDVKTVNLTKATADFSQQDFPVTNAIDTDAKTGWAIYPEVGKAHEAIFSLEQPVESGGAARLSVTLEFQSQFGQHQLGRFRITVTDSPDPHSPLTLPKEVSTVLAIADKDRSQQQRDELRDYFRRQVSPALRPLVEKLTQQREKQSELSKLVPTAMVMQEMPTPRDTFVLIRGQYDKHGEKVRADVPTVLPRLPEGAPSNRLGLALWLTHPSHPLTSRVIVNRYWQMFFSTGLVKTSDDFGSKGELPSHPELLDWLAVEFREPTSREPTTGAAHPWDVRAIVKKIVMSATYRQSSRTTPEMIEKDPENRLLGRGTRHRLQAEFVRDQALAISGLLDRRIGGKSVFPYQPTGLWEELMSREDGANWTAQVYTPSHGADLYRRSMYTFWKRTSPPPTMSTFDAPDRETCVVRRATTNTPLQALILLNDPTFVESSRKFAERILAEGGGTDDTRMAFAFRAATARVPSSREVAVLQNVLAAQRAKYGERPDIAEKLLSVGESARSKEFGVAELAAWTVVASTILNLDETITKG